MHRMTLAVLTLYSLSLIAGEHPVPLQGADTNCLECHEAKGKGKYVHSAAAMGCTSCHSASTEKDITKVDLVQPEEQLCFACHERLENTFVHKPYGSGKCTSCHDPHASDYPKLLVAPGNDLCLSCHGNNPKVTESTAKYLAQLTPAEAATIPKLSLNRDQRGHPFPNHPVTGKSGRVNSREELTCRSCHRYHASETRNLIEPGKNLEADLLNRASGALSPCVECHNTFRWGSGQLQPLSGWVPR